MRPSGILEAIDLAIQAHSGQKRISGEDFVIHPLIVLQKLLEIPCPENYLITAVLHDTVEDTWVTSEYIAHRFGKFSSQALRYLSKEYKNTKVERIESYLCQLNRGVLWDEVVYLVKLVDVWHNIQTLESFDAQKRLEQRQEVRKYYLPFFYKNIFNISQKHHSFCLNILQDIRKELKVSYVLSCIADR